MKTLETLLSKIADEMRLANENYGPIASTHELYAVIKEELDEFWDLTREWKGRMPIRENKDVFTRELLQIAAVAIRGIIQIEKENE